MDIRHLKTFIAIADYGTFGAAGEVVFLSQSAVSQQVRTIEEFFGFKVFDRTVRPPELTAPGALLLESARKIVKEYDSVTQYLTGNGLSGRLSIGAIRASFKGALPKALAILHNRYPQLHIHVQMSASPDLVKSLETGLLDAAIIPRGLTIKKDLCWLPYTIEPLVVLAHKNAEGSTDIEILENSPYIRFFGKTSTARIVDKEFLRRDIHVHSRMDIDSLGPIIRMVELGLGVSVLPEPVGGDPFPLNVRKIPFGDPPLKRHLGIIYKEFSTKEKVISALHNELFRLSGSPDFTNEEQSLYPKSVHFPLKRYID